MRKQKIREAESRSVPKYLDKPLSIKRSARKGPITRLLSVINDTSPTLRGARRQRLMKMFEAARNGEDLHNRNYEQPTAEDIGKGIAMVPLIYGRSVSWHGHSDPLVTGKAPDTIKPINHEKINAKLLADAEEIDLQLVILNLVQQGKIQAFDVCSCGCKKWLWRRKADHVFATDKCRVLQNQAKPEVKKARAANARENYLKGLLPIQRKRLLELRSRREKGE